MSYEKTRANVAARFDEVGLFHGAITSLEGGQSTRPATAEIKIMRGLFFVHLYAAMEKSLNEIVRDTISLIGTHSVKNAHYVLPFNTIAIFSALQSFKTSSDKKYLEKSCDIFYGATSTDVNILAEDIFGKYLQSVTTDSILNALRAFGISDFVISPVERFAIDEVFEKRCAVAHGRESALEVGERFPTHELKKKHKMISDIALKLVRKMERYYKTRSFVQSRSKRIYREVPAGTA